MLRIYCDFNDCTDDDRCWILHYGDKPLEEQSGTLGLQDGQRVILYQDEGDFEVEGTLLFRQIHGLFFLGEKLCAKVDWTTWKSAATE